MKKPRADAKLKTLPEGVQAELWELLTTAPEGGSPMTYADARAWLLRTHSLETSLAALSEWYSWYGLALRSARAKSRAAQAAAMAAKDDPTLSTEQLDRVAQFVFTSESIEEKSVKDYVAIKRLVLEEKKIQLDRDKFDEMRRKARERDEAAGVMKSSLSPEEQNRRLREILK